MKDGITTLRILDRAWLLSLADSGSFAPTSSECGQLARGAGIVRVSLSRRGGIVTVSTPPGWYQAPLDPPGTLRWWDGRGWGPPAPPPHPPSGSGVSPRVLGFAIVAVTAVGAALADFTSVSLLSGTGTVWTGAVIAVLGAIASFVVPKTPRWAVITSVVLAMTAVATAIYDEVQLHNRRQELNGILNGGSSAKKLSHTAVEGYIEQQFNVTNVDCNYGMDFTMERNGETFTCSAASPTTTIFTVTVKDKDKGDYQVQPG